MASNNQAARINPQLIPSPEDAMRQFEEAGGHITHFSGFGEDPLASNSIQLQQRKIRFHQRYPTFDVFFHTVVNGDDNLFREGLLFFIHLTQT